MGKLHPDFYFKEQIILHELVGSFKELETNIPEAFDNEEEILEFRKKFNEMLEAVYQRSFISLSIPLLNISGIREDLSASEYFIFLIILAINLKGEFFEETNEYISSLTGYKSAQINNSIVRLIKKNFIGYVDENNHVCYSSKPKTKNQMKEYLLKYPEKKNDYWLPKVNNKRMLVVDPEIFEIYNVVMNFTKEDRAENRKQKRKQKILEEKLKTKLSTIYLNLTIGSSISPDIIPLYGSVEFKTNHPKENEIISVILKNNNVTIDDLILYLNNFRKK